MLEFVINKYILLTDVAKSIINMEFSEVNNDDEFMLILTELAEIIGVIKVSDVKNLEHLKYILNSVYMKSKNIIG